MSKRCKRCICLLLAAFLLLMSFAIGGCSPETSTDTAPESVPPESAPEASGEPEESAAATETTVTDMLGRQVSITAPVERVVAIGPGALRLYCYINGSNKLVGIEQMEKDNPTGRPYLLANPSLADLPVIGPGGPNNAPDPEKILTAGPEVIFSMYTSDGAAVDELQAKTGIPVVALSYGKVSTFDPDIYSSLRLIGEVVGQEKRAEELVAYMEECKQELNERTKNIPDSEKPRVYVGGLGARGTHGIESTQGNYSLFNAVNARNVVDETGQTGSIMIDKEKLVEWDPDKIFIDLAGYAMVQQDYEKNPEFYRALSAVQKGELYSQLPYNYYHTNHGTAIADAYYIGKVLYPEQFADIDPEKKADEIYQFLLGQPLYARMVEDFGGFKQLTLP